MHYFSGVEGVPVTGDQAILQINPPASLTVNSEEVKLLPLRKDV